MSGSLSLHDSPSDTTLAILAGGEGSRMGMPKAQLILGGVPILDYLLDHFAWPGPTMLVTARGRENPPGFRRFTTEVTDPESGGGPLRGVLTALENLQTPLLLLLTVDMPGIRFEQCKPLVDHLRNEPASLGVMTRRISQGSAQIEPFPLSLRLAARPIIECRLKDRRRSVLGLLEERGFSVLDADKDRAEQTWTNLNLPSDLKHFRP
jgi:molybdopterin-guanine dinucleotide biosynthesis protein A